MMMYDFLVGLGLFCAALSELAVKADRILMP